MAAVRRQTRAQTRSQTSAVRRRKESSGVCPSWARKSRSASLFHCIRSISWAVLWYGNAESSFLCQPDRATWKSTVRLLDHLKYSPTMFQATVVRVPREGKSDRPWTTVFRSPTFPGAPSLTILLSHLDQITLFNVFVIHERSRSANQHMGLLEEACIWSCYLIGLIFLCSTTVRGT